MEIEREESLYSGIESMSHQTGQASLRELLQRNGIFTTMLTIKSRRMLLIRIVQSPDSRD